MKWCLFLFVVFSSSYAYANTPRFAANQMQSNSKSISKIDEVIITENYNSGYAYSVTGSNIKTDSYISPEATYTTSQNTGNSGAVNFEWITPQLTSKPQWQVVNEGEAFSLTENFMAPGLDAISIINRTQTIETTQTSTTLFQ